jgi:hypothetical protein
MNTKKKKLMKRNTKRNTKKYNKQRRYNGGAEAAAPEAATPEAVSGVPNPLKGEGNKMKMRLSAIKNPIKDTTKGAIAGIITMENPIIFAYQLIEKHIFGWDVVPQERKMSETQKAIFGNKLKKKNKRATFKEFIKGEYKKPVESDKERQEREAKEKKEAEEKATKELVAKILAEKQKQ